MHNELAQNFEFKISTKATQTFQSNKQMRSNSTQAAFDPTNTCEVSIQCNIEHIQCNIEQSKIDGGEHFETKSDEETREESEAEYSSNNKSTSVSSPTKAAFIVYMSSLTVHLNKCLTCCLPASVTNITLKCSQLIVQLICPDNHKTTWISQPSDQRYSKGNLSLAAAVLFSANTFKKISKHFEIANIE